MSVRNLDRLLKPRSVALVGASPRPGSLGHAVTGRLLAAGFDGPIGLVNPKYAEIKGRACAAAIADLPHPPDLGVVATPPDAVPGVIDALGRAGARAAVVITAGLTGANGLRQAMLDAAKPYLLRVLGPNCVGLICPREGLDASFAHLTPKPGRLALLSQSGAIVTALIDWAEARGVGFSVVASLGDMADIDTGDMLDYLATDPDTRAILMYLEQITDARKFMSAARSAARVKPVIAVKSGRSANAAAAAASHTGALAGADAVYDAALRRAGVLRVRALEDLFTAAEALSRHRPLASDRLAVVTNGGGAGVLAADALADVGARLAPLAPETLSALDAALPPNWSRANPVDIIGDARAERYRAALEASLADPNADAALVMYCPTAMTTPLEAAEAVIAAEEAQSAREGGKKPILACWLGDATVRAGAERLEAAGLPVFETPAQAVRGFGHLVAHAKSQAVLMRTPPSAPSNFETDPAAARDAVRTALVPALAEGRPLLTEPEAKSALAAYGIPTVATGVATTPEAAEAMAAALLSGESAAEALVVKILSPDITHKSDIGGVRLNLGSAAEARSATEAMLAQARARAPQARIDGVAVQPMIRRPDAHELILGLTDDPVFGPVMLFGAGGTSVEVVADKALALPPLDLALAEDLIGQTRIAKLLRGYRDRPAADIAAIAQALVRLSQLSADFPEIRELDVNPLLADSDGVVALDARIVVQPTAPAKKPGGNPRFALRPYPSEWAGPLTLGGRRLRLRPIRPEDGPAYVAFFGRLEPKDIRMRFFGMIGSLSQKQLAGFTQLDYARAMAFVVEDPETGEILGVSRLASDPDGLEAEYSVIVRSDQKGLGLGRALMTRLIEYATAEGIGVIVGDVLEGNDAMLGLCRALGFQDAPHHEDPELRRVRLLLPASAP